MTTLKVLAIYTAATICIVWWERHGYCMPNWRKLRDWVFGPPIPNGNSECFMSKALTRDIEEIMPGECLTITISGRQFSIIENEELALVMEKAGYTIKRKMT